MAQLNDLLVLGNSSLIGNTTIQNELSADTIKILSTGGLPHLEFARGGYNYIKAPTNATFAFVLNDSHDNMSTNASLTIDKDGVTAKKLNGLTSTQLNAAYTHSQSAHAPSNAQKNSDITKAEIEAKLTGDLTSHTHSTITAMTGTSWSTATRNITTDCKFEFSSHVSGNATGLFPKSNNANAIISFNRHTGDYTSQLGFSSNGKLYYRYSNGSALTDASAWEQIYTSVNKPTCSDIGAAASGHTHTKSQITDFPTSLKNPNSLTIQGNGTTLTDGVYDGSAAKTVNITPNTIGAIQAWTATVKGATWSRLCYVAYADNVVGSSYILNIGATRGNVVYNDTFIIKAHHSSNGKIVKISGNNYCYNYQIRLIVDSGGNSYVELNDNCVDITSSTSQSVYCRLIPLYCGAVTKYTNYTAGGTPSGYTAVKTLTMDNSDIQATMNYASLIPTGTNIPANTDLNTVTYIKVGNYYCSANATAATLTNCPTGGNAFLMQVYSPLSPTINNETTSTYIYRIRKIIAYNTGAEYVQAIYSGATKGVFTYGSWNKFTFDGHAHGAGDITSGTLAVARGGTGITSNPSMLVNLASTTAASVFAASPRPGVTGTLAVGNGGTGKTSLDSGKVLIGAGTSAVTFRGIFGLSSVDHLHWSESGYTNTDIIDKTALAYWDGRYSGSGCNLKYFQVSNTVPASNASSYPLFASGKTGAQQPKAHDYFYLWETGSATYLSLGSQDPAHKGAITLHSGAGANKYVNIEPVSMTAVRTISIPNETGTLALRESNNTFSGSNTFNGLITAKASVYADKASSGALNMSNSNIYGINALYWADASENAGEGINFIRADNSKLDTIWSSNGVLYYETNRAYEGTGTQNTIIHSGNITSYKPQYLTDIVTEDVASNTNTERYVFISYNDKKTNRPAYYDNLTFQTSTGRLTTPIIKINGIQAPTESGGTTYSGGTSGQVLKSNGSGGVYWASDSSSTQVRVYRQTSGYNSDYPILVSRTAASSIGTSGSNGSTANVYAVIGNNGTNTPTINPHTGDIKTKGMVSSGIMVVSSSSYGGTLPTSATSVGQIFFLT